MSTSTLLPPTNDLVDPKSFEYVYDSLRAFFKSNGYHECFLQSSRSILQACENPYSIATFTMDGTVWPLPQTSQMELEKLLLKDPSLKQLCCLTTSYRDERSSDMIPGRHNRIFPLFEFESVGNMNDLCQLLEQLVAHLGFKTKPHHITYQEACDVLQVDSIEAKQEEQLARMFGSVIFLTHFPESSSPFFNMKRFDNGTAAKVDVLLHGHETFGTAERSVDIKQQRDTFATISDGKYAGKLYELFGQERVDAELEDFFSLPHIARFGGGIGMTRLITAMQKEGLL